MNFFWIVRLLSSATLRRLNVSLKVLNRRRLVHAVSEIYDVPMPLPGLQTGTHFVAHFVGSAGLQYLR